MNSLKTLYFPGTDIYSIRQYPIFLLFRNINIIKPVEDPPSDSAEESADTFIKSGFCQVHTPCPLGDNRKRFMHLVTDIKNRKDDYAAQLSSLTLAAMSNRSTGEGSEREIINSIFAPQELQKKGEKEEKELKLWQARLVLKIGELLDQEEEEIAAHLAVLEDEQQGLFKELQGEADSFDGEENPFAELTQIKEQMSATHPGNAKKRFSAWQTLFLESDLNNCNIFLTGNPDNGDILLENYEKRSGLTALHAGSLDLPAFVGWNSSEACETALGFHEKHSELIAEITAEFGTFTETKDSNVLEPLTSTELGKKWREVLDTNFPEERFGRITVNLYLFPEVTCSALIGKAEPTDQQFSNGLLLVAG